MKKLNKKNRSQRHTIEAYADCSMSCACYCGSCSCTWSYLTTQFTSNSNSSGAMNYTPIATAQVR